MRKRMNEKEWAAKGYPLKCEKCGRDLDGLRVKGEIVVFCWRCAISPKG